MYLVMKIICDYEMINITVDYRTIIVDFELLEIECLNVVDLENRNSFGVTPEVQEK